jgi:hypothetical protein
MQTVTLNNGIEMPLLGFWVSLTWCPQPAVSRAVTSSSRSTVASNDSDSGRTREGSFTVEPGQRSIQMPLTARWVTTSLSPPQEYG